MSIAPISNENIKVGYISQTDGYVKDRSIAQANDYEKLNPGTTYIFLNGDKLSIQCQSISWVRGAK